jgi:hypothetical protein
MNRQHPRQSRTRYVVLLCTGLSFICAAIGWVAEARLGARSATDGYAEQAPAPEVASREHGVSPERNLTSSLTESQRADLNEGTGPRVKVRARNHGDFERVAFEWPEAIEYEVVQHAEQVKIAFGRPGLIDLSDISNHLGGLVLDAWVEDGELIHRVTLRVMPNAWIHSFSLEDGRVVAIDVFGGTAAPTAAPAPEQDAIQELRQALKQRDAAIQSLRARVEQLERVAALSGADLDRVTAGRARTTPSVVDTPPPQLTSPPVAAIAAPSSEPSGTSWAAPSRSAPPEPPSATTGQGQDPASSRARERRGTAQDQAPAPGQVEIDEEAVERALDFTLVQEGALLLPFGKAEFSPSFTYTRRTGDFPIVLDPGGANLLGEREVRRNEFEFAAGLLVGLPFDSQLEFGLPYNLVDQSAVGRVLGRELQESSETGHALGDFSVGLAKTVLRERNWWPDVVLRVNWDTGTGERTDNDVVLDGGFQELAGSISLIKRQDPLVFVGGASYSAAFEDDDIEPGDALGFRIGTFLAASPSTSLRLVLNQSFIDEFQVDGRSIDGSDQVESVLSLGASAVLGRNMLLDGAVAVGMTDDSPDYAVSISLPIRFSTPGL